MGCHHIPTNPQHHRLCRGQGPNSRRNSIVHKGNNKLCPGHPFPAGRDGGEPPCSRLPSAVGKIQPLLTSSLLIPKRDLQIPASSGSSCASPHARSSFQAAAKEAASPRAATMQQLTGPGVKGNVRASARNIKISDKGAIVAQELLNFRWIHEPFSFTNQPGAMQHPWIGREREKDKPMCSEQPRASFPWVEDWELFALPGKERGSGAVQHSLQSRRLRGILCPWKPGQASRKAGAELPKSPRAMLKLQETGHRLSSSLS